MATEKVQAIVIGAGAGGGIVACELSEAGIQTVLLERGVHQGFLDHDNDELTSQRTTVLGNAYGPDNERYRRVFEHANGRTEILLPNEGRYNNIAACVGGGTLSYGAMAWRFMPEDFKMKSTYGHIDGSTLEDWPISYEDLEPNYTRAEWEIGVSGNAEANPYSPSRSKPYPMPAFPYNLEGHIIDKHTRELGLNPFPIPMFRNSRPYNGRAACIHMRTCVGFACPTGAKGGSHNTVIPRALATGNCSLLTSCKVSRLILDQNNRVKGIEYFNAEDQPKTLLADVVVVSASATETARLLLNSKSNYFPNGAGNNYDWVGRNLQGHAYSGAFGLFEEEVYDDMGPGATIALCDYNHNNPGVIGGSMLANEFIRMPYLFTRVRPKGSARWGKAHKDFQKQYFKRHMGIKGPVQEIPAWEARVRIDPEVKDHWGIPVLRISGQRHPEDLKTGAFIARKAEEILHKCGAIQTWQTMPGMGVSGGQHQAGTCRMGNDLQTSVTNSYGRVHEIENLFIADGSLHVTNGGFNPALTIMALAFRVGEHIVNAWRGNGLGQKGI
ncbi:MAG: GMC family oxidoreductase [Cyclobacteriaceae bacterium]|nr:GMC family oxidoreductase [Cyclobacteriaceae bacterium]